MEIKTKKGFVVRYLLVVVVVLLNCISVVLLLSLRLAVMSVYLLLTQEVVRHSFLPMRGDPDYDSFGVSFPLGSHHIPNA